MYIMFRAQEKDIDLWVDIFSYLEHGSADAKLQDKIEVFGIDVDGQLEKLIDDYGTEEALQVEFWSQDGTEFSVMVNSSSPIHKEAIMGLLRSCPVDGLRIGNDADW